MSVVTMAVGVAAWLRGAPRSRYAEANLVGFTDVRGRTLALYEVGHSPGPPTFPPAWVPDPVRRLLAIDRLSSRQYLLVTERHGLPYGFPRRVHAVDASSRTLLRDSTWIDRRVPSLKLLDTGPDPTGLLTAREAAIALERLHVHWLLIRTWLP